MPSRIMNHDRMTVYTFATLKGGSGKTTSAVSLAETAEVVLPLPPFRVANV